jgi:hypothetical protein
VSTIDIERWDDQNPYDAYAKVTVNMPNGQTVGFTIHPSRLYSDTVNVEIDGDLTGDTSMRIQLNDRLIIDTTVNDNRGPDELTDTRESDLDEGVPIEGFATYDHTARPDDDPEPGDRCKTCGAPITWMGPSHTDWLHVDEAGA